MKNTPLFSQQIKTLESGVTYFKI